MPVRQKSHAMAQPTCVDTQKVMAGVSGMKTDSMRRPSARASRSLRVPSTEVSSLTICGVETANSDAEPGAQRHRQVGHAVEVGDRAAVDPTVDLAGVEPLLADRLER